MQGYTEIPLSELRQYASNFREALLTVCESAAFRTSPKSCEFLRHVFNRALNGDADELKERLIGMSLLGREATYDTGSDAGVRVRANDVRKRLTAYNSARTRVEDFAFDLPSGSYVPRFYMATALFLNEEASDEAIGDLAEPHEMEMPLPLQRLAAPTAIALFLCVICLRWQMAQEHPFITFWQNVFQGHTVRLYLPPAEDSGGHTLVAMQEIQAIAPLLNLAGQFHTQLNFTGDSTARDGEVLISIGPTSESKPAIKLSRVATEDLSPPNAGPLVIVDTAGGRRIFDRTDSKIYPAPGESAALLTISNRPIRSIRIDGTDEASVDSLVRLLCERDTFPEGLADGLADGASIQAVFPMAPGSQPVVFRGPPSATQANREKAP
jgi:hypothetical protein